MKKILLFDVDGTIAESGKKIDVEILDLLHKLKEYYEIGIVGGGKYEKIYEQINFNYPNIFTHIFSECGCVYHKFKNNMYIKIYEKDIRKHKLYTQINLLLKRALNFISKVDYTITGNFIDLRTGIIYISLIGLNANQIEREYFIELDKKEKIREKLLTDLKNKSKELGIDKEIKILEGGSVGIGIYPKEYGKEQVLEYLLDYEEINYFGDKYTENGNDYELITNQNVLGYPVDSLDDTKKILKNMINNFE